MKTFRILFLLIFSLVMTSLKGEAGIFGLDDRYEMYQRPILEKKVAPSVAVMLSPVFLDQKINGYEMKFNSISDSFEVALCKGQRFYGQPTASVNCTGFLVAPDLILTAGHCMTGINTEVKNTVTPQCKDFMWAFDYKYKTQKLIDNLIPSENIFSCKEVIFAKFDHIKQSPGFEIPKYGDDIALIRLDRRVDRTPIEISNAFNVGDSVYTIGYPSGLPQKVTVNGKIKSTSPINYFTNSLDIFGGNSGGPILNDNNQALGVVVRAFPSQDYTYLEKKECSVVYQCSQNLKSCVFLQQQKIEDKYSHASKISKEILDLINKHQMLTH